MKRQARLEHKHEQIVRLVPFRLGEIDVELTLPPEPEANPARGRAAVRTGLELAHADPDHRCVHRPAVRRATPRRSACSTTPTRGPTEAWMQQVAAEMHLSETTFAHPLSDGDEADWALRWFTPEVETNLCGHATLATAHAMYRDRGAPGTVRFASRSGVLVAHTADDGTITLDFPAAPATEVAAPDGLAKALGVTPRATFSTGALGDLIALLDDEAAVRSVTPDLGAIARIARRDGIRGTIVTAAAADPAAATTSCRASLPRPTASPRTQSRAAPILRSRRSGRSASVATTSPACRPRPAAASCAPRSAATACTSPATLSSSSTACSLLRVSREPRSSTLLACETRSIVAWSVRASTEFGSITGGSRIPRCAADRSWRPFDRDTPVDAITVLAELHSATLALPGGA